MDGRAKEIRWNECCFSSRTMTEYLCGSSYFESVIPIEEKADCVTTSLPLGEDCLVFPSHISQNNYYLRFENLRYSGSSLQVESISPFYSFKYLKKKKKLLCISWDCFSYFDLVTKKVEIIRPAGGLSYRTCFSLESILDKEEEYIILGSWRGHYLGYLMKFSLVGVDAPFDVLHQQTETIFCLKKMKKNKDLVIFGGGNIKRDGGTDYSLKILSISKKKLVSTFPLVHTNRINIVITFLCEDNNVEYICSGGADKKIYLWTEFGICVRSFDCTERVQSIIPIDCDNYIIGGAVYKEPGGNIFHFSLKTGKFTMLTQESIDGRFIWSLKWWDDRVRKKFVMTSGIEKDKVHVIELDRYFHDSFVNIGDLYERKIFLLENNELSYVDQVCLIINGITVFEGPKFFWY